MNQASTESTSCYHCALPISSQINEKGIIQNQQQSFCCTGCKSVCQAIYAAGLEGFYQRTPEGTLLAPPPKLTDEIKLYDIDAVQEEYVSSLGSDREINLLVEGIHCAACVWLIENSLQAQHGVQHARVNLSGKRLQLRWSNHQVALSVLLGKLGELGYKAVPYDPDSAESVLHQANRQLLYRLGFAAFSMMNLLWISIALYSGANQSEFVSLFHWVGFFLATPTLLYSAKPFYQGAWLGLKQRHLSMDLPIAIGASITYLYSVYVTLGGQGDVYYDTVVNFIFVILVGRYLEAGSKRQAVAATARLLDLQPKVARQLNDSTEQYVPIRSLSVGDIVLLKPGELTPVDGVVVQGCSQIDESMLSGESRRLDKIVGSKVSAGTMNGQGALHIQVEGTLRNTTLGKIIQLVENAQSSKAPIQCMADKIVPWFVAITLILASLTFVYWLSDSIEIALMAATSVLIITCPCAFGLATPMSMAVASGLAAKYGMLIKNAYVLEILANINRVVFDKTGTLTEGNISVCEVVTLDIRWTHSVELLDEALRGMMADIAVLEGNSEHLIAQAFIKFAQQHHLNNHGQLVNFMSYAGQGVVGRVDGKQYHLGSADWLKSLGLHSNLVFDDIEAEKDHQGISSIRCACDGKQIALLCLQDQIRTGAKELIDELKQQGIQVTLLSGDRRKIAQALALELGGMQVIADVLPEQKDKVIADFQAKGQTVVMVGDGVNDAPALVRADVGIALGSGTDISMASADVVLMSSELKKIHWVMGLSQRTLQTIRQNITISIVYNMVMVPLAMMAWITPLIAAVSMPISSLLVIANAARIRSFFSRQETQKKYSASVNKTDDDHS